MRHKISLQGKDKKFDRVLRRVLKSLAGMNVSGYTHHYAVLYAGELAAVKLEIPHSGSSVVDLIGYMQTSEDPIKFEEYELSPVRIDTKKLGVLSGIVDHLPTTGHALLNGSDLFVMGPRFAYMTPLRIDTIRERGKGENISMPTCVATALSILIRGAVEVGAQVSVFAGTPNEELLVIDTIVTSPGGEFDSRMRIELPMIFAPWANLTEPMTAMMGATHIVVDSSVRTLRAALNRAEEVQRGENGNYAKMRRVSEIVLANGEMLVKPLLVELTDAENKNETEYADEPLGEYPVKVASIAGDRSPHYQFVCTDLLNGALSMFEGSANLCFGQRIGAPIVLWEGETRMAVRTAERI